MVYLITVFDRCAITSSMIVMMASIVEGLVVVFVATRAGTTTSKVIKVEKEAATNLMTVGISLNSL